MMRSLISDELAAILQGTEELRGAYLVGGCVRDWLLNEPSSDTDIEVFGVGYNQLLASLSVWGRVELVGRSFGMLKLTTNSGRTFDFSIPRTDRNTHLAHPRCAVGIREAAAGRDYTINALMFDPHQMQLVDFFGGQQDLANRVLRHTSVAFADDPLRVLRGMQLVARFGLSAAPETLDICRSLAVAYPHLAVERVWQEWWKWAVKSVEPSLGLRFLLDTGWITHFPEIHALVETPQDPVWHPEGDVFAHTCHCLDALVSLPQWQAADMNTRAVLSLAVLAHDFGKPMTTLTTLKNGRSCIVSPGHEIAGGALAFRFLQSIHATSSIAARVVPLVINHLAHLQATTDRSVRRLAKRLEPATIKELCALITADQFGRPPRPRVVPHRLTALQNIAMRLNLERSAPPPILMGRHLLQLGLTPSARFREILEAAYDAQLEGVFFDLAQAFQWLADQQHVMPSRNTDQVDERDCDD